MQERRVLILSVVAVSRNDEPQFCFDVFRVILHIIVHGIEPRVDKEIRSLLPQAEMVALGKDPESCSEPLQALVPAPLFGVSLEQGPNDQNTEAAILGVDCGRIYVGKHFLKILNYQPPLFRGLHQAENRVPKQSACPEHHVLVVSKVGILDGLQELVAGKLVDVQLDRALLLVKLPDLQGSLPPHHFTSTRNVPLVFGAVRVLQLVSLLSLQVQHAETLIGRLDGRMSLIHLQGNPRNLHQQIVEGLFELLDRLNRILEGFLPDFPHQTLVLDLFNHVHHEGNVVPRTLEGLAWLNRRRLSRETHKPGASGKENAVALLRENGDNGFAGFESLFQ